MKIVICAAFPHELKYIIRRLGASGSPDKGPFPLFHAACPPHELAIIQTGMGSQNAEAALTLLFKDLCPGVVFFVGFGGALYPSSKAGDMIWAQSVVDFSGGAATAVDIADPYGLAEKLSGNIDMKRGTVVTLSEWMGKKEIAAALPGDFPFAVCDMETYPAARYCTEREIPFFALRAVTDTFDEEIPPELFTVTDEAGKYELPRALSIILGQPHLIPDIIRLGRNSKIAAEKLYEGVKLLIEML